LDMESYRSPEYCENSAAAPAAACSERKKEDWQEDWLAGDRIEFRDPSYRKTTADPTWLLGIVQEVQPIGPSWARVPRHVYWIKAGRSTYKCRPSDMRRPACLG
jgi:hypothetical protein